MTALGGIEPGDLAPSATTPAGAAAHDRAPGEGGEAPASTPQAPVPSAPEPKRRGPGRNLPAAIGVGATLLTVLAVCLFVVPPAFIALAGVALVLGSYEAVRALDAGGLRVPMVPVLVGALGMVVSTAVYGAEGLVVAAAVAVCVILLWRVVESSGLLAVRDAAAGVFTLAWVPFLGCFALLLHAEEHGSMLVLLALVVPIANDTGGYIAGVLFGAHPMAPSISPKKSWEGFVGSLVMGTAAAVVILAFGLSAPWWIGLVLGPVLVVISTCGDLAESLLKRDLGIKDMGSLLPGHGGVLDRLDSILLSAPATFLLLELLLP